MKFLLDVNASGSVLRWLLEHDHDVLLVENVNPRMKDDQVLQWAFRENRILITTDQDFEEMIWQEKREHKGILRLENLPRAERISLLEYVLKHYGEEMETGAIVIATSKKIRIRRPVSTD